MNDLEKTVDEFVILNFGIGVAGSPKWSKLKQLLNKVAIPKNELVKFVPYDKHKEALSKMILKDVLREKIKEIVRLTIKMYPHKHGEELSSEILECFDRNLLNSEDNGGGG